MDAKTAQSIFGGNVQIKKCSSKEEPATNFKSTNDSLVKKNLQLKQQLAQYAKTIEKLRNENVTLREKNQELLDATLEEKIELIVEQRVKSRLSHAAVLHKKLIHNLQQTGVELGCLFKDMEPEPSGLVSRRQTRLENNLDRLEESPILRGSLEDYEDENKDPSERLDNTEATMLSDTLANGTPRKRQSGIKGRRSELFQNFREDSSTMGEVSAVSNVNRRGPMLIAPSATPEVSSKTMSRKAPTPRFKKPSTPAPPALSNDSEMPSTVRRQRSAKMNIKSMKEPSTRDKLRRPGKHDEPMPYINTFF